MAYNKGTYGMTLENWSITADMRFIGLYDGSWIMTSMAVDTLVGNSTLAIKTQSGSLYELGEPSVDYESLFPNAKQSLREQQTKCLTGGV